MNLSSASVSPLFSVSAFLQKPSGNTLHAVAWNSRHTLGEVLISEITWVVRWRTLSQCAVTMLKIMVVILYRFNPTQPMIMDCGVCRATWRSGVQVKRLGRRSLEELLPSSLCVSSSAKA